MTTTATVPPGGLPLVRESTDDERWHAWRARGAARDARTARRLRVVMGVVIVVGIAVASVVLR
jgi:hypothetical protein